MTHDDLTIGDLVERAHGTALEKGWWSEPRGFGEMIALCHSELSEALEAYRETGGYATWYQDGKPEGVAPELADVLIRIADMAGGLGIPLAEALAEKLAYNQTRPHRHGGKAL